MSFQNHSMYCFKSNFCGRKNDIREAKGKKTEIQRVFCRSIQNVIPLYVKHGGWKSPLKSSVYEYVNLSMVSVHVLSRRKRLKTIARFSLSLVCHFSEILFIISKTSPFLHRLSRQCLTSDRFASGVWHIKRVRKEQHKSPLQGDAKGFCVATQADREVKSSKKKKAVAMYIVTA